MLNKTDKHSVTQIPYNNKRGSQSNKKIKKYEKKENKK